MIRLMVKQTLNLWSIYDVESKEDGDNRGYSHFSNLLFRGSTSGSFVTTIAI